MHNIKPRLFSRPSSLLPWLVFKVFLADVESMVRVIRMALFHLVATADQSGWHIERTMQVVLREPREESL